MNVTGMHHRVKVVPVCSLVCSMQVSKPAGVQQDMAGIAACAASAAMCDIVSLVCMLVHGRAYC